VSGVYETDVSSTISVPIIRDQILWWPLKHWFHTDTWHSWWPKKTSLMFLNGELVTNQTTVMIFWK